jgi:hypothetical protein
MKSVFSPRKSTRRILIALLMLLALCSASTQNTAVQAITLAQAASAPQAGTDIPCNTTPFGRVLALGKENEIFLGYNQVDLPFPNTPGSYRFDWNPTIGQLQTKGVALGINIGASPIAAWAATAADLDGDGRAEFVQGFTDANGQYQIVVNKNGNPLPSHTESWPGHTYRAMASGDILGRDDATQQVVVASRGGDGALAIAVFGAAADGNVGSPVALWRSNVAARGQATLIQVAVGNLDNDPYDDIVVSLLQSDRRTAQLIYLEYQPNYQVGSGPNMALNLQERATSTYGLGVTPQSMRMTLADLNGDAQETVVLAWDEMGGLGGRSPLLWVRDFDVINVNGTRQFVNREQWQATSNAVNFAVAAGDVDGDRRDEIIVGYDTDDSQRGNLNFVTLSLISQNTPTPELSQVHRWQGGFGYVGTYLALAVGDLNKDNRADVVAAFKDTLTVGFRSVVLTEKFDTNQRPLGLQLSDTRRHDSTINGPINLVMGDWDNDSLKAFVKGRCARVVDAHVTAASFVPPYWKNIQGGQQKSGSIGQSTSQNDTVERSLTYSRSETVSAYVGVSAGVSFFDLAEISAAARATGAHEYAISGRNTTSTGRSTVTTVGQSWSEDALVYERAEYNCFNYQLAVNNVFVSTDQARLRFCEYQRLLNAKPPLTASELNSWDANNGGKPEYTPVIRDWSSLALFRGAFTDQSSNAATARLAVDSEIVDGSYVGATTAQTANQNNPWWQVDLGSAQEIGKIRLWAPKSSLSNFYVFVSDTDFRTIAGHNDPRNLLNRPGIQHYSVADLGNGLVMTDTVSSVTTFLTLDSQPMPEPIQGRYVRVQRADAGVLALAEVQVFGANHTDPDRYPLDLRDTTKNDGWFEVRLYNPYHTSDSDMYVWVKTRGNLLWDGRLNPSLNGLSVDRGNAMIDWSLSNATETSRVQAQEIVNNTSVGAEFEVEGGVGIKVQTGGGVERTTGIASEVVQSTSWGSQLNMGGSVQGFPPAYDGVQNQWVLDCRYRFQPYYYELSETSNLGYQHRFPVLDYLIPDEGHGIDLNRTQDLSACRNGNQPSARLQAYNDTAQTNRGTPVVLNVLANDLGSDLQITDVSTPNHGTATHIGTERSITYTPAPGFTGIDTFTYTASSGTAAGTTTGIVSVVVGNRPGGRTIVYLPLVRR